MHQKFYPEPKLLWFRVGLEGIPIKTKMPVPTLRRGKAPAGKISKEADYKHEEEPKPVGILNGGNEKKSKVKMQK